MGKTSFNPKDKNAETLVIEWLYRTNRKTLNREAFNKCASYWAKFGVDKDSETYSRAFRRDRERGLIAATTADKTGTIRILSRPQKRVISIRHDQNKHGRTYWGW